MAASQKEILRRTIDALETSLKRYPDNEKILHQLALAYAQTARFDPKAVEIYQQASKFFPSDVKIQRALSIGFLISQSTDLLKDLQQVEDINKESLARNIERLARMTQEFPDSPYIHRALGDLQLLGGSERESIHHYRCAMALGLSELEPLCGHFEQVRRMRDLSGYVGVFFAELYQRFGSNERANQIFLEYANRPNPERVVLDKFADFLQRRLEDGDPDDGELEIRCLRQLTKIALLKGNVSEALTWARQLSPEQLAKDARLAKELARRLLHMEDFRLSFEYLSRVPLDDDVKSLLNEMTVALEKRGELDTAVYILQYINENDEYSRESLQLMRRTPATDDYQIEIDTELQMAELHWKNRRWEEAFDRYLRVLELGYRDYRALLEPIDLVISRLPEIPTKQLVFLTNFFADKRDWRRCMMYAQRVLQQDPNHGAMSQRLLQACERILTENPDDHAVRLAEGDEQLRLGNIEVAMQDYRACAAAPEYKMKANRRLAMANFRAGDLVAALEKYRELPVLEPEDLERLYDLAIAFSNATQFKEAYQTAKMIQDYDPKFRDVSAKLEQYEAKVKEFSAGFVIDPKMRELIGDHSIGRYRYIGKIGSGGMGVVHKVMDLKSNQVVAMKILREGLSSSGKAIDRFFREARIAATLHHKNIVNILDYNISNNFGQSYIAMEFVDGPSLRDIMEKKFADSVDIGIQDAIQALDWTSQLCDALDATHKKGIIHRDIKPDNIMIGPGDMVKITDFGIVHIEEATFTPTGALIGTPRYMSPEQVHGGRIDARSDIYATGIILYELLIGSPPFISGDISYQQVNVLPTPPREISPAIPQAVDRIIMRCLEKAPADRYQTALECKHDIDEAYIRLGGDRSRRRPESVVTTGETMAKHPPPPPPQARGVTPQGKQVEKGAVPPSMVETFEDAIETPSNHYDPDPREALEKDLDTDLDMESWSERPQDAPR
ncbi:protein kinase [Candidatus Sumerlaeota bacterium]|nr:protein kinase [Candidatus Sumerlaeota bacterium]